MSSYDDKVDYRFKLLYFIGIVLVVSGHISCKGGINLLGNFFGYYGYHMALFVFCSGYFYKKYNENDCRKFFLKKIKSLIVPMYVYNFFYSILAEYMIYKDFHFVSHMNWYTLFVAPLINGHQFALNLASWFVVPLFFSEIIYISLRKLFSRINNEYFIVFLCVLFGIFTNVLALNGINTGFYLLIDRLGYFLAFYSIGFFYKVKLEQKCRKISNEKWILGTIIIQFSLIILCKRIPDYSAVWMNNMDGPVIPYILGCNGIAFWLRMSEILEPLIGRNKYVNLVANNTFSIMMNQFLGFMFVKSIFYELAKYNIAFPDFDLIMYKNNLYYYYIPLGLPVLTFVYFIAGITIPLLIQKAINCGRKIVRKYVLQNLKVM